MRAKVQQIIAVLNKKDNRYAKSIKIKKILGGKSLEEVINEFENEMGTFPKGSLPIYSIIIYMALMRIIDRENFEKFASVIKEKESYTYMKIGFNLLLTEKTKKIKYNTPSLSFNHTNNVYRAIKLEENRIIEFAYSNEEVLSILDLIYHINNEEIYDFLKKDKHYIISLSFILTRFTNINNEELLPLLKSEDRVLSNAAFYLLMKNFNELIIKTPSEEINRLIDKSIVQIYEVISLLNHDDKIILIINYLFSEQGCPYFFLDYIKLESEDSIFKLINQQSFNNIDEFQGFRFFLMELKSNKIEEFFIDKCCTRFRDTKSQYEIELLTTIMLDTLNLLKYQKENLINNLIVIKRNLLVTSFDRQVRFLLYHTDCLKKKAIDEISNYQSSP